jgi:hypothetical protein
MFSMMLRSSIFGCLAVIAGLSTMTAGAAMVRRGDNHGIAGRYRWVPSADAAVYFKRHRVTMPTGQITLNGEGMFRYTTTDEMGAETTLGTYLIDGDRLTLTVENGDGAGLPRRMKLDSVGLSAVGVRFVRERLFAEMRPPAPLLAPPPVHAAPVVRGEMEGVWTLRTLNGEMANQRFTFSSDGTFRHRGDSTSCAGKYTICEDGVVLVYTEVDGQPVDPAAAPLRKKLPFVEGRGAFIVDDYRYARAGG